MLINKFFFLYLLLTSQFFSQNIDLYFSLVEEGKIDGVRESLPELLSKYPRDPGVLFLKALTPYPINAQ